MELIINAETKNLAAVNDFIDDVLAGHTCSPSAKMHIELMVEEIFVNIASYAYSDNIGTVTVKGDVADNKLTLVFIDSGVAYDPLAHPDPDLTLSAEEREIGGLGIYLVKKYANHADYEYKDGQNILTICKSLE